MKKALIILFLFFTAHTFADQFQQRWHTRTIHDEVTQLLSAKYTYIDGVLRLRCFYFYDETGRFITEIMDNGSSEDPDDWSNVTERVITTHHPDGSSSTEITAPPSAIEEAEEKYQGYYIQELFSQLKNYFSSMMNEGFERQDAFLLTLSEEGDRITEYLIGPVAMRMIGNNTRPSMVGVYGPGEINEKVRITFTNGIMNAPSDHEENLTRLSQTHGHTNIHYIFRQFDGWNHDILRCAASKLGLVSTQAQLIAKKWKDLIAEMGGVEGGGTILHYAHSIGGTETDVAKTLMTKDELKMIHVTTIGSATLIPNKDFASVVNFVSLRDGVSYLDPIDYFLWGNIDPNSNVYYIGTLAGFPLVDHPLSTDAYREVIDLLGARFIEKYVDTQE